MNWFRFISYWTIYHWQLWAALALVLRIRWTLIHNEDLQEYGPFLKTGLIIVAISFGLGWMLGQSGPHWLAPITGTLMALPAVYFVGKVCNRAFNEMLGGLLFDLLFSEGSFSDTAARRKQAHSVTLLRHWRDNGLTSKAYRYARWNLSDHPDSFDMWLFAIETATVHQNSPEKGRLLTLSLFRRKRFTDDQKFFAAQQLKAWAASRGVNIVLKQRTTQAQKPLHRAVELRNAGYFQEAETAFRLMLERDPENLAAAQLLIRLYAEDMKEQAKAWKTLEKLKAQPFTPPWLVDFIEKSIPDWLQKTPRGDSRKRSWLACVLHPAPPAPETKIRLSGAPRVSAPTPETSPDKDVPELLREGRLQSALEQAEAHAKNEPNDFIALRQLLDIHCSGVPSLKKAEKVLHQIEHNPSFSEQQKNEARAVYRKAKQQQAEILYRTYS